MQTPEDDLCAFVGPNADYYLKAWAGAEPNGGLQALRWNWPAFFFNFSWLLHRRMYKYFWIAAGISLVLGMVEAVVERLAGMPPGLKWFDLVINIAAITFFGTYGTWFYYAHARWRIAQTKAYHTSPEAIVSAGGVRWVWPVIIGAISWLVVLAAIFLPGLVYRR